MAVTLCPWCQSEIPVEEGQEPDKYCPVCDNEIDGYRTLTIGLDDSEDEDESEHEIDTFDDGSEADISLDGEFWDDALGFSESGDLIIQEKVEQLLDDQEHIPECPNCREYMLEAGEQRVEPGQFIPKVTQALGAPVLEAPFAMTIYVCPACFTIQTQLSEDSREQLLNRLSESASSAKGQG
jgi:hypothetical protein